MFHGFARRGTAVLMLVLALTLAGARPAAAQAAPFHAAHAAIAWLAGLWQAVTASTGTTATPVVDRGAGLDPNGNFVDRGAGLDPNGDAPPPAPGSAP